MVDIIFEIGLTDLSKSGMGGIAPTSPQFRQPCRGIAIFCLLEYLGNDHGQGVLKYYFCYLSLNDSWTLLTMVVKFLVWLPRIKSFIQKKINTSDYSESLLGFQIRIVTTRSFLNTEDMNY